MPTSTTTRRKPTALAVMPTTMPAENSPSPPSRAATTPRMIKPMMSSITAAPMMVFASSV